MAASRRRAWMSKPTSLIATRGLLVIRPAMSLIAPRSAPLSAGPRRHLPRQFAHRPPGLLGTCGLIVTCRPSVGRGLMTGRPLDQRAGPAEPSRLEPSGSVRLAPSTRGVAPRWRRADGRERVFVTCTRALDPQVRCICPGSNRWFDGHAWRLRQRAFHRRRPGREAWISGIDLLMTRSRQRRAHAAGYGGTPAPSGFLARARIPTIPSAPWSLKLVA